MISTQIFHIPRIFGRSFDLRLETGNPEQKWSTLKAVPTRKTSIPMFRTTRGALQQLQKNKDIQILPADKGRFVVLNTVDYHSKCEELLGDSKNL